MLVVSGTVVGSVAALAQPLDPCRRFAATVWIVMSERPPGRP